MLCACRHGGSEHGASRGRAIGGGVGPAGGPPGGGSLSGLNLPSQPSSATTSVFTLLHTPVHHDPHCSPHRPQPARKKGKWGSLCALRSRSKSYVLVDQYRPLERIQRTSDGRFVLESSDQGLYSSVGLYKPGEMSVKGVAAPNPVTYHGGKWRTVDAPAENYGYYNVRDAHLQQWPSDATSSPPQQQDTNWRCEDPSVASGSPLWQAWSPCSYHTGRRSEMGATFLTSSPEMGVDTTRLFNVSDISSVNPLSHSSTSEERLRPLLPSIAEEGTLAEIPVLQTLPPLPHSPQRDYRAAGGQHRALHSGRRTQPPQVIDNEHCWNNFGQISITKLPQSSADSVITENPLSLGSSRYHCPQPQQQSRRGCYNGTDHTQRTPQSHPHCAWREHKLELPGPRPYWDHGGHTRPLQQGVTLAYPHRALVVTMASVGHTDPFKGESTPTASSGLGSRDTSSSTAPSHGTTEYKPHKLPYAGAHSLTTPWQYPADQQMSGWRSSHPEQEASDEPYEFDSTESQLLEALRTGQCPEMDPETLYDKIVAEGEGKRNLRGGQDNFVSCHGDTLTKCRGVSHSRGGRGQEAEERCARLREEYMTFYQSQGHLCPPTRTQIRVQEHESEML